ncbi:hypothetical protein KYN89_02390 [Alteriqipengyuania sp. NZ-12B]|uniref:Uncharacterized protein n=1 Tax=Alteriqipengyuania abyssalis TaxID=2860200 RepID=A0ABS7PA13_9SPHN|nr:hypothetical protein [Alteriqipengyuania abyssalis]MBY8335889.1 hypothetical protein [Alteriqipengyuania abyssalis]
MFEALILAVVVSAGETFSCTPTAVWDGDGPVWCEEGPRLRLAGIAAREADGTCNSNQPCPDASHEQARDTLAGLIGTPGGFGPHGHRIVTGPTMRCRSTGGAGGNRTGAWCVSPKSGDVSCAMVRSGTALRWDPYWGEHKC